MAFEATGDEYPDDFEVVAGERCVMLFDAYVEDLEESPELDTRSSDPHPI